MPSGVPSPNHATIKAPLQAPILPKSRLSDSAMHSRQSTLRARPRARNLQPGRGASNRSVPYKIQGRLLSTRATGRRCGGIDRERPGRRPACVNSVAAPIPSSPGIRSSGASFPHLNFGVITAIPAGPRSWRCPGRRRTPAGTCPQPRVMPSSRALRPKPVSPAREPALPPWRRA